MKALVSSASAAQLLNQARDLPRKCIDIRLPPATPLSVCDFQIPCRLKVAEFVVRGGQSYAGVSMEELQEARKVDRS